jgi:hypothetical protein
LLVDIDRDFAAGRQALAQIEECGERIGGVMQHFLAIDQVERPERSEIAKQICAVHRDAIEPGEVLDGNAGRREIDGHDLGGCRQIAAQQRGHATVAAAGVEHTATPRQPRPQGVR